MLIPRRASCRARILLAAAASSVLLAGCSATSTAPASNTASSNAASSNAASSNAAPSNTASSSPVTAGPDASPAEQIAAAETEAAAGGKRVLLDFGADWCPDCRSLDAFYQDAAVAPVLADGYVLVRIDVGHFDQNMDVSHQYGDAAAAGIPALAVLDPDGTMLVDTSDGSFANARDMDPQAVARFLTTWRPVATR